MYMTQWERSSIASALALQLTRQCEQAFIHDMMMQETSQAFIKEYQLWIACLGNSLVRKSGWHEVSWEGQRNTWSVVAMAVSIDKFSLFQYLATLQPEIKYFYYKCRQFPSNIISWPGFHAAQMKVGTDGNKNFILEFAMGVIKIQLTAMPSRSQASLKKKSD